MSNKTIIACRPGMKQAMESAFAGMKVIVDDKLDKDYEFREEAMTLDELMEQEISKEERQDADPKNALTFIVPLHTSAQDVGDSCWSIGYLSVRCESNVSSYDVVNVLKDLEFTTSGDFPDYEINTSATISSIKAALKKAGVNVLSISEADGLTGLKS